MNAIYKKIKAAREKNQNVLKLTQKEALTLYKYIADLHRIKLPDFDTWLKTAFFYGFSVKVYE
ncbi:MAG: hypothetical protein AAB456_03445 [Patescibacteria group bacterium]